MRSANKRQIILGVNMTQKSDYEIELVPGVKIWMNSNFGTDKRITEPVVAVVKGLPPNETGLAVNDVVVCHHNAFNRIVGDGMKFGDTGYTDGDGLRYFTIGQDMVYFKIDADGEPYPLSGYLIIDRIDMPVDTMLEIPDTAKKTFPNKFRIKKVPEGFTEFSVGDVVYGYKYSDYEMIYNYRGKKKAVIRMKVDDVLGIVNDVA